MNKKNVNKPVDEGPVKMDAESVVVPAEDGERTRLEAIDSSYTYVIVDKPYVFFLGNHPLNQLMNKKNVNKPVDEGPVKMDAESVVVPAEDGERTRLEAIDSSYTYVIVDKPFGESDGSADRFVATLEQLVRVPKGTFSNVRPDKDNRAEVTFKVNPNRKDLNASLVAAQIGSSIHHSGTRVVCFDYSYNT
ncbi:unnamed protein product [Oppiella nova]|uniref:Protein-tyrosine phosphatase receptor IA-2 ectodomain domain-containing protein n=1 Tax=Oppiella nova TaxID=334625 RepID=A0A7R9QT05_9ACAR|nr:unnamed protein product [Oppiella nova]CAG2173851.1 unnamed protein product [Oppiella nova]